MTKGLYVFNLDQRILNFKAVRMDMIWERIRNSYSPTLVYRCVSTAVLITLWCYCTFQYSYEDKVFIFLSSWSYTLLCVYHLVALANELRLRPNQPDDDKLWKTQRVLFNITSGTAIIVTVLFWSLDYSGLKITVCTLALHGFNMAVVLADVVISRTPVDYQGLTRPPSTTFYGMFYGIFSFAYWLAGGTNHDGEPYIYKSLDYGQHPIKALTTLCVSCFIVAPMCQVILFYYRQVMLGYVFKRYKEN